MCSRLTSFPFGERYMTSRFILNKLDFDFPASGLLVRLGLVLFFVVVARAIDGVMVVDKRIVAHGASGGRVGIGWSDGSWMHVQGPLPLAHRGRGGLLEGGKMRRCLCRGAGRERYRGSCRGRGTRCPSPAATTRGHGEEKMLTGYEDCVKDDVLAESRGED